MENAKSFLFKHNVADVCVGLMNADPRQVHPPLPNKKSAFPDKKQQIRTQTESRVERNPSSQFEELPSAKRLAAIYYIISALIPITPTEPLQRHGSEEDVTPADTAGSGTAVFFPKCYRALAAGSSIGVTRSHTAPLQSEKIICGLLFQRSYLYIAPGTFPSAVLFSLADSCTDHLR